MVFLAGDGGGKGASFWAAEDKMDIYILEELLRDIQNLLIFAIVFATMLIVPMSSVSLQIGVP